MLAGARTAPPLLNGLNMAMGHLDSPCAFCERTEIDGQGAFAIELPKGADAVSGARGDDVEFRLSAR